MRGGPVGTCQRKPVMDLAMPVLRTEPDVAAARADREENHDPGGNVNGSLDEGAAIREQLSLCKTGMNCIS